MHGGGVKNDPPPLKSPKMIESLQNFAKTWKTTKIARKNEKIANFRIFFTPRGQKTPIFAIFCHFLAKFENAVTFEQIITERCLTPKMKDLIQYFQLKKKARPYLFSVFQNFASKLAKNSKIRKIRKNRLARVNILIFLRKIEIFNFFVKNNKFQHILSSLNH